MPTLLTCRPIPFYPRKHLSYNTQIPLIKLTADPLHHRTGSHMINKTRFTLAAAILGGIVTQSQALDLLGYWDFNNQTDDQSGNGNAAVLADGAVISPDTEGFSGTAGDYALELGPSGNSARADINLDLSAATSANAMAVSFWQFDIGDGFGANAPTTSFGMLSSTGGGTRGFQSHSPWSDGNIYFDHGGACCGGGNRLRGQIGTSVINGWHHIVLQVDNGSKQIWIDGELFLEQLTGAVVIPTFNNQLMIGAQPDITANGFGGRIDEFAVWDDVLTPLQITRLFNGESSTVLVDTTDSDGDLLPDVFEQLIIDADPDDAIASLAEVLPGDDFDNDMLTNAEELAAETDPIDPDTDGDSLLDGIESNSGTFVSADSDTGTDPNNDDSDGDGLLDGVENPTLPFVDAAQPGTDPNKADTDEDTFGDLLEIENGSNPTDPADVLGNDELELLGYWDFDNNSDPASAPDLSGNSPAATLVSPAVFSEAGLGHSGAGNDRSLDLGASNNAAYAQVPAGDHLKTAQFNNSMCVSFWQLNTDTLVQSSSFWITSGRAFQAHVPWSDGTLYFDHNNTLTAGGRLTIPDARGAGLVVQDQWQHILLQKTAEGNKEIYIDGILQGSQLTGEAFAMSNLDGQVVIGAEGLSFINSFSGRIDEFAIFSKPLDQEKITRLAEGTPAIEILGPPVPLAITSLEVGEDGRTTIVFPAKASTTYAVEVSSDLETWTELIDDLQSDTGEASFTDSITTPNQPKLFYRIIEL